MTLFLQSVEVIQSITYELRLCCPEYYCFFSTVFFSGHPEKGVQYEDNGVKYEFKVYEKIASRHLDTQISAQL